MVPAGNTTPPGDKKEPQEVSQTSATGRPVTPLTRDDRKGQKFKEVLGKKLDDEKKEEAALVAEADDEGEMFVSPLTLASKTLVKKPKDSLEDAHGVPEYLPAVETEIVAPTIQKAIMKSVGETKQSEHLEVKEFGDLEGEVIVTGEVKNLKTLGEIETEGEVIADTKVVLPADKKVEADLKSLDQPLPVPPKKSEAVRLREKVEGEEAVDVAGVIPPKVTSKGYEGKVVAEGEEYVAVQTAKTAQPQTPVAKTDTTPEIVVGKDKDVEKAIIADRPVEKKGTGQKGEEKGVKEDAPVIAQVNLAAQPQAALEVGIPNAVNKVPEQAAKAREVLIKLATEMIDKLERVTLPDRTDTTIKIAQPGIFNGAEVLITEYKIAQRQFNVTFSGLSPEARALVAMQPNQEALRTALIEKGYTLQMVTIEHKIPGLQSASAEGTAAGKRESKRGDAQADAGEHDLSGG